MIRDCFILTLIFRNSPSVGLLAWGFINGNRLIILIFDSAIQDDDWVNFGSVARK